MWQCNVSCFCSQPSPKGLLLQYDGLLNLCRLPAGPEVFAMTGTHDLLTTAHDHHFHNGLNMVHFDWIFPAAYHATWSNSPASGNQLTAPPISSPKCPQHMVKDRKTQQSSSVDHHPLTYGGLVPSTLMSHLMFKHCVSCGESVHNIEVHFRFFIITHVSIETPSRTVFSAVNTQ